MFRYRVGLPLWKTFARIGVPLLIRIEATRDEEADVFYATSPDLDGLAVEAKTLDELRHEVIGVVHVLLELAVSQDIVRRATTDVRVRDQLACVA